MGYIIYDILTSKYQIPPSVDKLWLGCSKPKHKIIAGAGYMGDTYPILTHFFVHGDEGCDSVDIKKNIVKKDTLIEYDE
mgnify:FL=1